MSSDLTGGPTTILNGRYRLDRVLGEGAFGRVYIAYDTRLQRTVAIKEILAEKKTDPDAFARYLDRFEREARAAGSVFHPNVVNVFELAIDADQNYYLIMEYVDRGSVRDLLKQVKTLPVERALAITLDVARALEAIHEADIVHRDIKPANVMLTSRGVAKLADFGVAQLGHESMRTQVTTGHPGTPLYMSPEQRESTGYLDGRSDLYSLGLVLYEMLTGEAYGQRRLPLEALRPDVPASVVHIYQRLTEQDPDRRYQSATELIGDLEAAAASESQDTATGGRGPVATVGGGQSPQAAPPAPSVAPLAQWLPGVAPPTGAGTIPPTPPIMTGTGTGLPPVSVAPPARRPLPAVLGFIGGLVVAITLFGGWYLTHRGTSTGTATATPVAGAGTRAASVTAPASPTTPATASPTVTATASPTATPTTGPPTPTPTRAATAVPVPTIPPGYQQVVNQQNGIAFAYPKAWQRSDEETDQVTIFAFRMSPTAAFLVAKEDNPTATTLDAYIDDEIKVETTQRPGWKVGPRAHQAAMIGNQPAEVADFLVPTATGQEYHYYLFTLRPKQAWGLLFTMPLNDFAKYQPDIEAVARSFVFCPAGACPTPVAGAGPARTAPRVSAASRQIAAAVVWRRPDAEYAPDYVARSA